jgi:hypothetical protein
MLMQVSRIELFFLSLVHYNAENCISDCIKIDVTTIQKEIRTGR